MGIIRNVDGNLPNILSRISAHKKAIGALLPLGLARNHRSSPSVSLRIHSVYCTPVLLSGLASLVLSPQEIQMIDSHYLDSLRNIQRLHRGTPRAVVLFMAGSLPGQAILHMKQLTLFSMICHKPDDPLYSHATYILTRPSQKSRSWFTNILAISKLYGLPHPLSILQNPPVRAVFKRLVKEKVRAYWESFLSSEIAELKSAIYFQPSQYSLVHPCFSWQVVVGNNYECAKALVVAKMISGRYRTEYLCKYWTPSNREGYCLARTCTGIVGDLEHILITCPAFNEIRKRLRDMWLSKTAKFPSLNQLFKSILSSPPEIQVQFILDPTFFDGVMMQVEINGIELVQHVLYLTRTYAYYIHRERLKMLGCWPGDH